MKKITITLMVLLMGTMGAYAQSTASSNSPFGNRHLGWDDSGNAPLWINQNNTQRMWFTSLPTWTGLNGATANNVSRMIV